MIDDENYENLICPHCIGFTHFDTTADEIICVQCDRLITEEDLNVFTGETTIPGEEALPA